MNKRKSSYVLCTLCNIDKTCDRVIKLANQSSNFVVLHVGMLVATLGQTKKMSEVRDLLDILFKKT